MGVSLHAESSSETYVAALQAELAVHVRKVQDVRRWLDEAFVGGPSGKLRKYRVSSRAQSPRLPILLDGRAKTATMRVLAQEFDCEILEWRNAMEEGSSRFGDDGQNDTYSSDHESLFSKFEAFLTRASACQTIFADASDRGAKVSPDPPNILHAATQQRFHAALQSLIGAPQVDPVPVVVIIQSHRTNAHETHFASAPKASGSAPTKEMLDIVVETSNGDIRSAIMALHFSWYPPSEGEGAGGGAKFVLEAVTRREQSLTLFHFMGRVLYNKWKGGPPNSSAAAKDIQRDQALDVTLKDPPKLPKFLAAKSTGRVGFGSAARARTGYGYKVRCGLRYVRTVRVGQARYWWEMGKDGAYLLLYSFTVAPSPPLAFPPSHSPRILHHRVAAAHPRARVECTTGMCLPYARAARYARPHLPRLLPYPPSPVLSIPFLTLM
ncbi:hypothetical protein B0H16DRAFT_1734821 [Mycena metata]|uniref:Uncharacterized protein n=1 Tax=Mycena metata TaxID=1033252 RepID=A0AAD7HV86_9AGAR|nr:hypothetical protein B0H16DRAFT_1734821 [Mycena metata]